MSALRVVLVTGASFYLLVAVLVFVLHIFYLQMVTPGLAAYRAAVWPIWMATGKPYGTPLPMD